MFVYTSFFTSLIAFWRGPDVVCNGLPWCNSDATWDTQRVVNNDFLWFLWSLIAEWIKYVAVLAVLALMVAGVMYLVSAGEEEKVKKAKSAIIWSLVGVLLSTSAWAIINMLNAFRIN